MKYILYIFSIFTFLLAACAGTPATSGDQARPAPDFTLQDALGGEVALEDYSGQPVLLFFHMAVG